MAYSKVRKSDLPTEGATPSAPAAPASNELIYDGIYTDSDTISLVGEVNDDMYSNLIRGLHVLSANHAKGITIQLNSGGGDWDAGIGIYDALKSWPYDVRVQVYGCAMSMGSVIMQAGAVREIGRYATVMVHDGSIGTHGTPSEVHSFSKYQQVILNQMYEIYAEASGKPVTFWKKKCKTDFFMSAHDAIKLGLADSILGK